MCPITTAHARFLSDTTRTLSDDDDDEVCFTTVSAGGSGPVISLTNSSFQISAPSDFEKDCSTAKVARQSTEVIPGHALRAILCQNKKKIDD